MAASTSDRRVLLYVVRLSANCHGPWLALEHFKIPHSVRDVNIAMGENRQPEFIAISPTQTVPVLRDGDLSVWDCNAILRYLANQFISKQSTDFLPSDPRKRAHIDMALEWRQTHLYPAVCEASFFFLSWAENRDCVESACKRLVECFSILDKVLLNGKRFIGGERPSAADFSIVPTLAYLRAPGCPAIVPPNIATYIRRFIDTVSFYSELLNGAGGLGLNQFLDSRHAR